MMRLSSATAYGIVLAFISSILWAAYFPLILLTPSGANGSVLALPFLFGGLSFLPFGWLKFPAGDGVASRMPKATTLLLAGAMMAILQIDVIFATRIIGAVVTALFTLLGDVLGIPLISYMVWNEGGKRIHSPRFWAGVSIATAGATLAVLAGGVGVVGWWELVLLGVPLPILVGSYFALVAKITQEAPISRVVPAATLAAFAFASIGAITLLGGGMQLFTLSLRTYLILVVVGVTTFFVAPWTFFEASRRLSVVVPAVVNATIPIFTMIMMVAFLGAPVYLLALLGIPLAFGGSILAIMN